MGRQTNDRGYLFQRWNLSPLNISVKSTLKRHDMDKSCDQFHIEIFFSCLTTHSKLNTIKDGIFIQYVKR